MLSRRFRWEGHDALSKTHYIVRIQEARKDETAVVSRRTLSSKPGADYINRVRLAKIHPDALSTSQDVMKVVRLPFVGTGGIGPVIGRTRVLPFVVV